MNFEVFTNSSSAAKTTLAQNTLWLHCAFSNYGGETKFEILLEILALIVHGEKRNKSILILLQIEYVFT